MYHLIFTFLPMSSYPFVIGKTKTPGEGCKDERAKSVRAARQNPRGSNDPHQNRGIPKNQHPITTLQGTDISHPWFQGRSSTQKSPWKAHWNEELYSGKLVIWGLVVWDSLPLSNNPFHKGFPRNPNHQTTISR